MSPILSDGVMYYIQTIVEERWCLSKMLFISDVGSTRLPKVGDTVMARYWEDGKVRLRVIFPLCGPVEPSLIALV